MNQKKKKFFVLHHLFSRMIRTYCSLENYEAQKKVKIAHKNSLIKLYDDSTLDFLQVPSL